jgi:hypothetical protein
VSFQDDYRQKAEECQRIAATMKSEADKVSWLKLADAWTRLATWRDRYEETFNTEVEAKTTAQLNSTAAH